MKDKIKKFKPTKKYSYKVMTIWVAVFAVIGIVTLLLTRAAVPTSRDPYVWPFSKYSIWNMPIGSNAQYVNAGFGTNDFSQLGVTKENQHIALVPSAPITTVGSNNDGWPDQSVPSTPRAYPSTTFRCDPNTNGQSQPPTSGKLPADWFVGVNTTVGNLDNNLASFLSPNSDMAVHESVAFSHCPGKGFTAYSSFQSDIQLNGDGLNGQQGASGLPAIGGTLRLGELRPGQEPPHHALKINLSGFWDSLPCGKNGIDDNQSTNQTYCYRWPAHRADQYANDGNTSGGSYGMGSVKSNIQMGALLAIASSVDCNALGLQTEPAKQICWTLQNYGGYYTEDAYGTSGWRPQFTIAIERGYSGSLKTQPFSGDFDAQFKSDYGFSMISGQGSNWYSDMMKIVNKMQVIANNGPNSIGGGGNPRQCLAPPFINGIADAVGSNPNGNVTEPTNCASGSSATPTPTSQTPAPTPAPAVTKISQTNNLALGKVVSSSSNADTISFLPATTIDKDETSDTSRWISTVASPSWLQVDLGAPYDLSKVDVLWAADTTRDFQIQTSTDGTTFTTKASGTTDNTPSYLGEFTSALGSARYVRFVGTTTWNPYGHSIREIGVYGTLSAATPVPVPVPAAKINQTGNLATNKSVISSSNADSVQFLPATTIDKDETSDSSRWISTVASPSWLQVDLGSSFNLSKVAAVWAGDTTRDFQIQTSTDGTTFTTKATGTTDNTTSYLGEFTSNLGTARYVRFVGTTTWNPYGHSIREIGVYGTAAAAPAPTTWISQTNNLATGKTVTSSSNASTVSFLPATTIDKDETSSTSRWISASSTQPSWLQVDLGASYDLTKIAVLWAADSTRDYQIQTSTDGTTFATKASGTTNNTPSQLTEAVTGLGAARYVRFLGTSTWVSTYGQSIREIGVYGTVAATAAAGNPTVTPADTTAPSTSITSPTANTTLSGTASTLTVDANDNVAVTLVEFYMNGILLGPNNSKTKPYTFGLNTTLYPNANNYVLTSKAYDAAGNSTTSSPVTVTINNVIPDTVAPVVQIAVPVSNTTILGPTIVNAAVYENGSGVARVDFQIDNGPVVSSVTTSPYSYTLDTTKLTNAAHSIKVTAYDKAGNPGSATANVTVNNPPTPVVLKCDFNKDGRVNNKDLSILLAFMSKTVTPYTKGDCNGDGKVNNTDLYALMGMMK